MAKIILKGREIPLLYTSMELKAAQEEIGPLDELRSAITGVKNVDGAADTSGYGSAEHLGKLAKMIRIMGNAGLEEAGEAADLTEKKILRAIRPAEIPEMIGICVDAINEGWASEIPTEKKSGPVDVVLEEIEKKKETGG